MDNKELPTLKSSNEELTNRLLEEDNIDNIKNIIDLFNLNIKKKDIIRVSKLNDLQDKIYDQINDRVTQNPHAFSNKDLITYFKVVQETIDKSDISSENMIEPKVQLNQNNVNINMGPILNRDSRQNVLDAVKNILNSQIIEENND